MSFSINNIEFPWHSGMTMKDAVNIALQDERLCFLGEHSLLYTQNYKVRNAGDLAKTPVNAGDDIQILVQISGG